MGEGGCGFDNSQSGRLERAIEIGSKHTQILESSESIRLKIEGGLRRMGEIQERIDRGNITDPITILGVRAIRTLDIFSAKRCGWSVSEIEQSLGEGRRLAENTFKVMDDSGIKDYTGAQMKAFFVREIFPQTKEAQELREKFK